MSSGRSLLLLALFGSILLATMAQLLLKMGMSSPAVQRALMADDQGLMTKLLAVALSPQVLLGLACFVLSALSWLLVLAKVDLSTAYPFSALGIALTVTAGMILLGEAFSPTKITAVAIIVSGVALLGWSSLKQVL